jgi:F-type H+-transporting ATPase subunit alpha
MGTELDAATQKQLDRGARLVEILKQGQYVPMDIEDQVSMIYAGTQGFIDKVPVNKVKDFESKFLKHMRSNHSDLLSSIVQTGELKEADKFGAVIQEFVDKYLAEL